MELEANQDTPVNHGGSVQYMFGDTTVKQSVDLS